MLVRNHDARMPGPCVRDRVAEGAKRQRAEKVLIDARDVVGIPDDSQQYKVGRYVAAYITFRVALVEHPAMRSYFGEWVALTGGADARLFVEEVRAIASALLD